MIALQGRRPGGTESDVLIGIPRETRPRETRVAATPTTVGRLLLLGYHVLVEFTCPGRLTDPLAGRRRPDPLGGGGMGLYLVQQLCDLVQIRTGPAGTTVRVSTWARC